MGDSVLVYFGYPRAHEDDAERAVRAGLDVVVAVEQLAAPRGKLEARIGLATGLVVVGDLIGEGASSEQAVVGEAPNLAARLQALAQPGTIIVPTSTRSLLGNIFKLRDLGRHELKRVVEPERSYLASLDWARHQQAKSWELRTAMSYAWLIREQGRTTEAYDLLAPIYAWFTEGFGTKDLTDAKALLGELQP